MNEHERVREMLPLAASGDLSPGDMKQGNEHVAKCAACSQVSEDLAALGGALRALPTPQPPDELVVRVCRLAETKLASQRAQRNSTAFLAPLVAASWVAALVTWPLVRTISWWILGAWHVPGGSLGSTLAAYSVLGMILACASALAVGMRAREFGRTK
jgi:predicted anti-sigma-YlaC factor YlaD